MIMKASIILLAIAISTSAAGERGAYASSSSAPPAPAATTAGCLLVSNAFAKHAVDEKDRVLAQSVLYFFLGRIGDATTAEQLKSQLRQQGPLLNSTNATPLMNTCLGEMKAKAQMLETAAHQIQQAK